MFRNHQPLISEYARQNPDNFARVLKFVVLTIQTRLFNIPADMETIENPPSKESLYGVLYGSKIDAIAQIDLEMDSIYAQAESIHYHAENERELSKNLLALFATIKGIGLAKAGFCAQLIYGVSACLDTHNLTRFGINPNMIKSSWYKNAKTLKTRLKVIDEYCDLVDRFGGSESLWDSWCEFVYSKPDNRSGHFTSADHVSAYHCVSLGIAA